ncbi:MULTISPECIES: hypothetical protein [unclassified Burkholderia]|uniref:hypothetical protein n=1 Tax=unclassified Burkholderia TaxID=2613784 RepID=UPI000F55ECCB|nr:MULTISPECIES: hypothetical protein [unclassified Burkholderia]
MSLDPVAGGTGRHEVEHTARNGAKRAGRDETRIDKEQGTTRVARGAARKRMILADFREFQVTGMRGNPTGRPDEWVCRGDGDTILPF